jgi:hypothetical protein
VTAYNRPEQTDRYTRASPEEIDQYRRLTKAPPLPRLLTSS